MVKRWLIGLSALAMLAWLGGSAVAEGPHGDGGHKGGPKVKRPGGPGHGGVHRPNPEKLFGRFDKNGDGKLTKDEMPERAQHFFSKLDTNGDGAVTKEEMAEAAKRLADRRGKFKGPDVGKILERLDKNGDGKLTKDEVPEPAWKRIGKADTDGNGEVTKEELTAALKKLRARHHAPGKGPGSPGPGKGPRDRGAMFQRADKNGDGKLTKDEVPERLWERISKADADGDGAVTKEELKQAAPKRQKPE